MGSGTSCCASDRPANSPPEKLGLPILGNAISFAKSPINFIQKTSEELGQVFQTEIATQDSGTYRLLSCSFTFTAILVGNEALNAMLNEDNVKRSEPQINLVKVLAGGEKHITPFLDGDDHKYRRQLLLKLVTPDAINTYVPTIDDIFTFHLDR